MDDLLALFEESPPEEPQRPAPDDSDDETGVVGDAARSITETTRRDIVEPGPGKNSRNNKHDNGHNASNSQTTTTNTQQQLKSSNHVACTVDSRVDIRMKNRKISSIDLLDMISGGSSPYHSPASLAAMSMAQLNRLLTEPAVGVVDMSTVQGKANIMTVGIVFSNSATRIAASGNAFCILTIGTLRTGPAVTLLLFGSAYGQHVKQCKPGVVIAVFSPKLVPPKQGGGSTSDTAITFTLNDARQISLLGESEDYDVCQGRVRGKNEAGAWVSDAKRCRTVVDKRVCLYCPLHRCQQNNNNVRSIDPTNKGTLKMQALRLESTMGAANSSMHGLSERRMILPQNSIPPHHQMKHQALQGNNDLRSESNNPRSEDMLAEYRARQSGHRFSSISSSINLPSASQNRLLSVSNHHRRQIPTAGQQRSVDGKAPFPIQKIQENTGNSLLNPYSKKQVVPNTTSLMEGMMMSHATTMMRPVVNQQRPIISTKGGNKIATTKLQDLQNILHPPMKRGATSTTTTASNNKATKRPRKAINTVSLEGFDGSVVVPKPKPIFSALRHAAGSNTGGGQCFATNSSRAQQQLQQEQKAAVQASAVRAKQEQLAARLREKQQQQHQQGIFGQGRSMQKEHHRGTAALRDSLFGTPLDDAQREELLQAKSQFADEAKSEEYARSRKVVVELEKQEEKQTNQSSGKNKKIKQAEAKIQKQWHCRTCGKSYPRRPRMCEQANHRVVLCREIQKEKSTAETRSDLSNKDARDGGLKLGSGIEWSYSRFS